MTGTFVCVVYSITILFSTSASKKFNDSLAYIIDLADPTDDAWAHRYDVNDIIVQNRGVGDGSEVSSGGDIRSSIKTFANNGLGYKNSKRANKTALDSTGLL